MTYDFTVIMLTEVEHFAVSEVLCSAGGLLLVEVPVVFKLFANNNGAKCKVKFHKKSMVTLEVNGKLLRAEVLESIHVRLSPVPVTTLPHTEE